MSHPPSRSRLLTLTWGLKYPNGSIASRVVSGIPFLELFEEAFVDLPSGVTMPGGKTEGRLQVVEGCSLHAVDDDVTGSAAEARTGQTAKKDEQEEPRYAQEKLPRKVSGLPHCFRVPLPNYPYSKADSQGRWAYWGSTHLRYICYNYGKALKVNARKAKRLQGLGEDEGRRKPWKTSRSTISRRWICGSRR